ncbi:hypothetical protein ACFLT1_01705 [Bacteroidota bacterium]
MAEKNDFKKLKESLKEIEARVSKLEKAMSGSTSQKTSDDTDDFEFPTLFKHSEGGMESRIGEYGMAWLGNIVLFFGILFIMQLLKTKELNLFSSLFGYASIAGIYFFGRFMRKQNPYMANLLAFNGHILLFIVTMRLHFATSDPLIGSKTFGILLLILVIIVFIFLAYHRKSQVLAAITLLMIVTTGMISNSTFVMLGLMVAISGVSVYFLYLNGWRTQFFFSIFLVYIVFLLWFFNNPFISHEFKAAESLHLSYIYLIICALLYSVIALLPLGDKFVESKVNTSIILNGLGFSTLLALIILTFFKENYYIILGSISAISIVYSALLQSRKLLKLSAALYGLYGFALLSITIAGIFKFPLAFLLLSIQSLLVVSMALWFSSRFIVAMNLLMYFGLLVAYLLWKESINGIDISFALVALVSARIINWQKTRLNIQTEWIRNMYLLIGFVMTLLSLYRTVPHGYITLSWALAAGSFFIISLILKNVKYRWLAIAGLISTAVYFFIVDLKQVSTGYRIVALLVMAIIAISFSLYYAKRKNKEESEDQQEE